MRSGKNKVLVLAANPKNHDPLRLHEEIREIRLGLERAKQRDHFVFEPRLAVRARDLQQAMLDVEPQVVHFCGHGSRSNGLVLENNEGNGHFVSSAALGSLFSLFSSHVECVVLNACYSEAQGATIAEHIPYVIGMNSEIGDDAAIRFAIGFYDALGAGRSIEFSYKMGCNAIELEGIPEHLTPVLKQRKGVSQSQSSFDSRAHFSELGRLSREEVQGILFQYKATLATSGGDGDTHFSMGLLYLHLKLYDLALRHFKFALDLCPDNADLYYYCAVASVRGRRIKCLTLQEVRAAERFIKTALQLDDRQAKYYYFWALILEDYYLGNGLASPPPGPSKALEMAQSRSYDAWEVERLIQSIMCNSEKMLSILRRVDGSEKRPG